MLIVSVMAEAASDRFGKCFQKQKEPKNSSVSRRARRRQHRRCGKSFAMYFPLVLKNIRVGFSLSHKAVIILDSFVRDMFERIATEASILARQKKSCVINSREIQSAVRLLLSGEMCERAVAHGTMALFRYIRKN